MSTSWLIAMALVGFQQAPEKATTPSVIAPGAKVEKVFGEGEFTEGGAMDADGVDPVLGHRQPDPRASTPRPARRPSSASRAAGPTA